VAVESEPAAVFLVDSGKLVGEFIIDFAVVWNEELSLRSVFSAVSRLASPGDQPPPLSVFICMFCFNASFAVGFDTDPVVPPSVEAILFKRV